MGSRKLERELDKELRFHVESRADDLVREGIDPAEARRRALAEFGCYEPIKEAARDARGTRWLGDLWQDLRYTRRVLWSAKAFTAAAVLSLGVGLGANAAVFRVMDGLMFRPLNVPRPTELFFVNRSQAGVGGSRCCVCGLESSHHDAGHHSWRCTTRDHATGQRKLVRCDRCAG
jgi:hypothetical protein